MFRIAGRDYSGQPNYYAGATAMNISARFPLPMDNNELEDLKNATMMEVLAANNRTIIGQYTLTGWRRVEIISATELEIMWATVRMTDFDALRDQIQEQNETLDDNAVELSDILDAIAELGNLIAEIVNPEEEE